MKPNTKEPTLSLLKVRTDKRGWFSEILKPSDITSKYFGQIAITSAKPNRIKGKHYHKKRFEWFIVITGSVEFSMYHVHTKKKKTLKISSSPLQILCIPPYWYHSINNTGKEDAVIILYYNNPFHKDNTDTYTISTS